MFLIKFVLLITVHDVILYADDTEFHASSNDVGAAEQCVSDDLNQVSVWLRWNGLISNHKKSEAMLVGSRHSAANSRDLQVTDLTESY